MSTENTTITASNFWGKHEVIELGNTYLICGEKGMGVVGFALSLIMIYTDKKVGIVSCSTPTQEFQSRLDKMDAKNTSHVHLVQPKSKKELDSLINSKWFSSFEIILIDELEELAIDELENYLRVLNQKKDNQTIFYSLIRTNEPNFYFTLSTYHVFVAKRIAVFRPEYYGVLEDVQKNCLSQKAIVTIVSTKNIKKAQQFLFDFDVSRAGQFSNAREYSLLV
jgi:hypothetical protein